MNLMIILWFVKSAPVLENIHNYLGVTGCHVYDLLLVQEKYIMRTNCVYIGSDTREGEEDMIKQMW